MATITTICKHCKKSVTVNMDEYIKQKKKKNGVCHSWYKCPNCDKKIHHIDRPVF